MEEKEKVFSETETDFSAQMSIFHYNRKTQNDPDQSDTEQGTDC